MGRGPAWMVVLISGLLAGCSAGAPVASPSPAGVVSQASSPTGAPPASTVVSTSGPPSPTSAVSIIPPSVTPPLPIVTPTGVTPAGTVSSAAGPSPTVAASQPIMRQFDVPRGSRPHDVAPAQDGGVWYTAQGSGELGWLDPKTGATRHIKLGTGSAPHGVIVGPDGAPWITDGGLNAIVRVDPASSQVKLFPLPPERRGANLNTAVFDRQGHLWFTGQSGIYGRLDPTSGRLQVFDAPRGTGPYGITVTPDGSVYYASLAGSHIARIDPASGVATVLEPPTARQGARRVWSDSRGRVWVSAYHTGQVAVYEPASGRWREWQLPGQRALAYAVYVDERDIVWLSDFGGNALVRFDPEREQFEVMPLRSPSGNVRQILGRPGEVWGAESGADKLVVVLTDR